MSLLDKLWDDTVAGPQPETGLGRLRRYYSLNPGRSTPDGKVESVGRNVRSSNEALSDESMKVTRSIMIIKPPGNNTAGTGSPPISPAGSTPPVSPFSGGRESHRFRRKSTSDVNERSSGAGDRSRSSASPFDV